MKYLERLPGLRLEVSSKMEFGDWLREQRKIVRVSQEVLGEKIGRSGGLISQLENGVNYSTKKPISPTPDQLVAIVEALQSFGSEATTHDAYTAAGIPIPTKEDEMNSSQVFHGDLPVGRHINVGPDDPMAAFTGEGLVWVVDPKDLPYREQIKRPVVVVIRGERQTLRYMGEFAEGDQLIKKFKRNGDEFTVPSEDAVIESILHSRIDIQGLG